MDRAPGLSIHLKLTLSYAGFLMVAIALLCVQQLGRSEEGDNLMT
jgi:hypothetical protein